ncbi:hypothetical protein Hanom_Chr06g00502971 [Helianthus anomalus]
MEHIRSEFERNVYRSRVGVVTPEIKLEQQLDWINGARTSSESPEKRSAALSRGSGLFLRPSSFLNQTPPDAAAVCLTGHRGRCRRRRPEQLLLPPVSEREKVMMGLGRW